MLFSSSKSSCPGKSIDTFALSWQKRQKRPLFRKIMHREVHNYGAGKTRFWRPSLDGKRLETRYGQIHNQHHSANTLTLSFTNLGKINSLYFWNLPTWVIKSVNGFCVGMRIMLYSTVNNCHSGTVTTLVRVALYRAVQGLSFIV